MAVIAGKKHGNEEVKVDEVVFTPTNTAVSLIKNEGDINWYVVRVPFNALTKEAGSPTFEMVGNERAIAEDAFRIAVINEKILA